MEFFPLCFMNHLTKWVTKETMLPTAVTNLVTDMHGTQRWPSSPQSLFEPGFTSIVFLISMTSPHAHATTYTIKSWMFKFLSFHLLKVVWWCQCCCFVFLLNSWCFATITILISLSAHFLTWVFLLSVSFSPSACLSLYVTQKNM